VALDQLNAFVNDSVLLQFTLNFYMNWLHLYEKFLRATTNQNKIIKQLNKNKNFNGPLKIAN
jgi:hypothetical protein